MSGSRHQIPSQTHEPGQVAHQFRVDAVTVLDDVHARAYECTHLPTGARLLHLHCHDEENLYSIAFRTPPADSTGVPHILEHSVLAGSRKYPVKDAFNELGKGTLNTFLNAMTWPDKTVYPVCSTVRADYFNLASVYTDLVLNPLLTEQTFRQEGHHLELADLNDPASDLIVSGVVYNEMKGAYSSPDRVVYKTIQEAIYPDNCYAVDSGGDPEVIPRLTHEQFKAFHRSYYSPSNARWVLYGDIPLADHLAFVGSRLEGLGRTPVNSEVRPQSAWQEPRRVTSRYPVAPGEDLSAKTYVQVSWMTASMTEPENVLLLDVLREALLGSAASPLRKALIDSGLGQDLSPVSGLDTDFLQTLFTVGLRGSEADRADAIEQLVLDTLGRLERDGIDPGVLEAALHQIEFRGKEIVPPFPVMLLFRVAAPANYGADPKAGLEFGRLVEQLRARLARDPRLFSRAIRTWLLDNRHRLRSVVTPSDTMAAEKESVQRQRMAERKAAMTPDDLRRVQEEARRLKDAQQRPETAEALASLPRLKPADVPRRVFTIPTERREAHGVPVLEQSVFSNGVAYVHLAFDLLDLDDATAPWVPLTGSATVGLGAAGLDYAAMATRIARSTGGVGTSLIAGAGLRGGAPVLRLVVHGKALRRNLKELTAILRDVLTASDPGDLKRVKEIVLESRNDLNSQIVPRGSQFAFSRAAATLGLARWRAEQWTGVSQARFLSEHAREVETGAAGVAEKLRGLQRRLFARARLVASVTGDPELVKELRAPLDDLIAALPAGAAVAPAAGNLGNAGPIGVAIAARVNYVAQAVKVPGYLSPAAPALEVLSGILSSDYLYTKLRVQGGAYGGFATYRPEEGLLGFVSYRDPHLTETLDVYQGAPEFVRAGGITGDLLERSKIGAVGGFDRVLAPGEQGLIALRRHLIGLRDEDRKAFRDGLLEVTLEGLQRHALPALEQSLSGAPTAVLAPREALEQANTRRKAPFAIEELE